MSKNTFRYVALAGGAVLAGGTVVANALHARQPEEGPAAPGTLTEVGGESLHVLANFKGSGPTLVFESALSCPCTEWGWVLRALDGRVPYLAYDRPGNGWSSQHTPPSTAEELNALTLQLLRHLDVPTPYLLIGHSVGGLLVRAFAANYPAETAGLVLVDSSHPDQLERSTLQREGMPLIKQGITGMYWRTRFGLLGKEGDSGFGAIADLPESLAGASTQIMQTPEPWQAARREFRLWNTVWAPEVRATHIPEGKPVGVLTAGQQTSMDLAHGRMQSELATLSAVSKHEIVKGAEHDSLVMNEQISEHVTEMIKWALSMHSARSAAAQLTSETGGELRCQGNR